MSRSLNLVKVQEDLQAVVHDLLDLGSRSRQPFTGIVFEELDVAYRDQGVATWRITIEPAHSPVPDASPE